MVSRLDLWAWTKSSLSLSTSVLVNAFSFSASGAEFSGTGFAAAPAFGSVSSWSLAAATGAYSTTAGIWTPPISPESNESCLTIEAAGGLPPAAAGALGERSPISFTAG